MDRYNLNSLNTYLLLPNGVMPIYYNYIVGKSVRDKNCKKEKNIYMEK